MIRYVILGVAVASFMAGYMQTRQQQEMERTFAAKEKIQILAAYH